LPFDEQVIPHYRNRSGDKITCKSKSKFNISIKRYNFTGIRIENKSNVSKLQCFLSSVKRKEENDDSVYFPSYVQLKKMVNYFPEDIAVIIACFINKSIDRKLITSLVYKFLYRIFIKAIEYMKK